ncbi:hypothetical protein PoB_003306800 [Plakobranchus ocellatus]|uniref:Uncharacterized protein n=1 Tax=Plakobranchus ocellatus TaxID=259542 RepID=A0AAV4AH17_9GAST|nr:hypothetical protein PoB_003306800 [Plakobranchus ocellatus]
MLKTYVEFTSSKCRTRLKALLFPESCRPSPARHKLSGSVALFAPKSVKGAEIAAYLRVKYRTNPKDARVTFLVCALMVSVFSSHFHPEGSFTELMTQEVARHRSKCASG